MKVFWVILLVLALIIIIKKCQLLDVIYTGRCLIKELRQRELSAWTYPNLDWLTLMLFFNFAELEALGIKDRQKALKMFGTSKSELNKLIGKATQAEAKNEEDSAKERKSRCLNWAQSCLALFREGTQYHTADISDYILDRLRRANLNFMDIGATPDESELICSLAGPNR